MIDDQTKNLCTDYHSVDELLSVPTSHDILPIYANGDHYEGQWAFDKRSGFGMCQYVTGDKYEGEWSSDRPSGHGVQEDSSTRWGIERSQRGGDRYEGMFGDGKKAGPGTFSFASGDRFKGTMKGDSMDGTGTMLFSNGDRYVGGFAGGSMTNGIYKRNPGLKA